MNRNIIRQALITPIICLISLSNAFASTSLDKSDLSIPSLVSPYYFGPNAFPIPDILDGTTLSTSRFEIGSTYFKGFQNDQTNDIYIKLNIPLFTDRVNLSIWGGLRDWWMSSLERQRTCRLQDEYIMRGSNYGDLYVSTDIWVLQAKKNWIDLSLRAALKSASGDGYHQARYYDSPGYFFDATIAKPIYFNGSIIKELRFAVNGGFLCWQTDNGRQNDAFQYGIMLKLRTRHLTIQECFGGYQGWEQHAAADKSVKPGDCPRSLKTDITYHINNLDLVFQHQIGLHDWPFNQFRFGIAYRFTKLF